mmetsp:Transcript_10774/g.19991  ORF Transcript_10774/g.19991 Transcript_10774/m.19991 type:complete len:456 (-) Transcript_10774:35-1402(-)
MSHCWMAWDGKPGACLQILAALVMMRSGGAFPNLRAGSLAAGPKLVAGLEANLAEHAFQRQLSDEQGYPRAAAAVPVGPPAATYKVHHKEKELGMGFRCPFESDDLIFASSPLFSSSECRAIREEAAKFIADGAQSSFTMVDTNRDVGLHELPKTMRWLKDGAFARVASFAAQCFPSAVDNASSLWIYSGLVIHYDASARLTHQPMHRDSSLVSCVIPLSERHEYEGGGTYIEPLGRNIVLDQGCALLHPSAIRHSGHRITKGDRWVLVLFLNGETMHYAEHGRRFRETAEDVWRLHTDTEDSAEFAHEEEEQAKKDVLDSLISALRVTGECYPECWSALGSLAHEWQDDPAGALQFYERAEALNPRDQELMEKMGAALTELDRHREAFHHYRRALKVDPYDADARAGAGHVLLNQGRLRGLATLLEEAPEDAMQDERLQGLAEDLQSLTAASSP